MSNTNIFGFVMVTTANTVVASHKYQIVFNYSENDPTIQKFINSYANYNLAFDYGYTLNSGSTWYKVTAPSDGMKPGYSFDFQATEEASFAFRFLIVNGDVTPEIQTAIADFMKNNCAFSIVQID